MKLKIFVGWDPREDIAWEVCRHSILSRTDPNQVTVTPLIQSELRKQGLYTREIDTKAATEFSLTRFLTPTLAGNEGYAIFVDCDFLFLTDIRGVLDQIDPSKAVSVVKHDYQPTDTHKMDGCVQYVYPRKNWSSFMWINCSHPQVKALTPEVVNSESGMYLHRFEWLQVTVQLDREQFQVLRLLPREVCERQRLQLHGSGGHQAHSWHEFVRARIQLVAKCQ